MQGAEKNVEASKDRVYKGVRQKAHLFKGGMNAVDKLIFINNPIVKYEISTRQN